MEGVQLYIHEKSHPWPGKNFVCTSCQTLDEEGMEPTENLCNRMKTVKEFCYSGNKLKLSGGCDAVVTARMRIGWIKRENVVSYCLEKDFRSRPKQEFSRVASGLQCCSRAGKRGVREKKKWTS